MTTKVSETDSYLSRSPHEKPKSSCFPSCPFTRKRQSEVVYIGEPPPPYYEDVNYI